MKIKPENANTIIDIIDEEITKLLDARQEIERAVGLVYFVPFKDAIDEHYDTMRKKMAAAKADEMTEADIEEVRRQIRENNADGSNKEPDTGDTTAELDMPVRWGKVRIIDEQTIGAINIPTAIQTGYANTRARKIGFENGDR
jgi:chorismate mutase